MKTTSNFYQWGATALMMAATCSLWTACSDDDDDPVQLDAPVVTLTEATATSLSFEWTPVANVGQYDYTLTKGDEVTYHYTTQSTSATFTALEDGATYTLSVIADPAGNSNFTASVPGTATGTTSVLPTLDQPKLSVTWTSRSAIYFAWDSIPEAETYYWTLISPTGEVLVDENATQEASASAFNLEQGSEYTIKVYAAASQHHNSATSTITASTLKIVDAPALSSEWQLYASNVQFSDYYASVPSFTCDLYRKTDGSEYCFHNFTTGYDLYFTATYALDGDNSYLGYYLVPSQGGSWDGCYYCFGENTWYSSFPLYYKNWPGHYVDYSAIYTYTTYTTINFDYKSGWICAYLVPYTDDGSYSDGVWAYLTFSWE